MTLTSIKSISQALKFLAKTQTYKTVNRKNREDRANSDFLETENSIN